MAANTFEQRWHDNTSARAKFWEMFTIEGFGVALALFAVVVAVFGYINQHSALTWTNILGDFYANVSSELLSIVVTVVVLDRLYQRRQDNKELTRLKTLLASNERSVTQIAIAELKALGWLEDGTLQGALLPIANFEETDIQQANLASAYLGGANLQKANLIFINLYRANLEHANLQQSMLMGANLREALLNGANLNNANLEHANMQFARLKHTNMAGVQCNQNTVLPNGENWSPNVDWSDFGAVEIEDEAEWLVYIRGNIRWG